MTLAKSFVVLLGLLATSYSKGRTLYTNQQLLYSPSQVQQVPWTSLPSFPSYYGGLPYQQAALPPYQLQYPFTAAPGFPYAVPSQYPVNLRPTVDITTPVVKEVDVVEKPPVPIPVPNIVPVSNMDAALLELENQGKVHAEKYYYGRSEIPYFPGMMPSYPPVTTTQYQYYEIPKYPFPYQQTLQYPSTPAFPNYYQSQQYFAPYLYQNPQQLPYAALDNNLQPQVPPQQLPSGGGGGGGGGSDPDVPVVPPPGAVSSSPGGPGVPLSPYLKPNQELDPDGRPFTVNKRKHVEVYEYH